MTSYPALPMVLGVHHFSSFPVSFILFWLPSLVKTKVPSDARASGVSPLPLAQAQYELPWPMSQVTEHSQSHTHNLPWVAALFTSGRHAISLPCYTMYLKLCTIHPSLPTVKDCGRCFSIFRKHALHPVAIRYVNHLYL